MPAVAACPSVPTFHIPAGFGSEFRPEPQGKAGRDLNGKRQEVFHQYSEPAEILNASIHLVLTGAVNDDGDELPYVSLALKPAFHVKVRYKYVGKLKSVPYPLDD